MAIKDWSTIAANNTTEFPEGMTAGSVNDGCRTVQADVRSWYEDAQWIALGHTFARVSSTQLQIDDADYTATYHAGRRIKVYSSTDGNRYYTILSVLYNSVDTVATLDAATLSTDIDDVYIGALSETNPSTPQYFNADETLTTAGLSSEASPVFTCIRHHDMVTITHKSGGNSGTSDDTTFTAGTLSSQYRPTEARAFACWTEDNGTWAMGMVVVGTSGIMTFYKGHSSGSAFTASGTKSFLADLTLTYPI